MKKSRIIPEALDDPVLIIIHMGYVGVSTVLRVILSASRAWPNIKALSPHNVEVKTVLTSDLNRLFLDLPFRKVRNTPL